MPLSLRRTGICQIPCRKKHTPQIGLPHINVPAVKICVCQFRDQFLLHTLPGDQRLYLRFRCLCRIFDDILNDGIAAAVFPVGLHTCVLICPEFITLVNDIPGAVHICCTKTVAVIPLFNI